MASDTLEITRKSKLKPAKIGQDTIELPFDVLLQDAEKNTSLASLNESLQAFSGALSGRDDGFKCDRHTIWGDKISLRIIRKA